MGTTATELSDSMRTFVESQPVFFVATSPLATDGHVNLSPKGLDTLRVLGPRQLAYLDLTGSGNETAAHLAENGRITFLWCAFEGPPRIVRAHARGRVVQPADPEWSDLRARFPPLQGVRQIVLADVGRVATSCGHGVPRMDLVAPRDQMLEWASREGEDGLRAYRERKNRTSIDGLPAPGFADPGS
jgi:hypothetical protein